MCGEGIRRKEPSNMAYGTHRDRVSIRLWFKKCFCFSYSVQLYDLRELMLVLGDLG